MPDRFEPAGLVIELAEIVVHEGHQPNAVADLGDSDLLAGKDVTAIDFPPIEADLADLAGVTRASVNAIETGRMMPSILLALKLARALGVSVDAIFTLSGGEKERT